MKDLTSYDLPATLTIRAGTLDEAVEWYRANIVRVSEIVESAHGGNEGVLVFPGLSDDALKASDVSAYTHSDQRVERFPDMEGEGFIRPTGTLTFTEAQSS